MRQSCKSPVLSTTSSGVRHKSLMHIPGKLKAKLSVVLPVASLVLWEFVPVSLHADASSEGQRMHPEKAVETQKWDTVMEWDPGFLWTLGSLLWALQSCFGAALPAEVTLPCTAWGTWDFLCHRGEQPWQPESECRDFQKRGQEGEAKFVGDAFQLPVSETFSSCFPPKFSPNYKDMAIVWDQRNLGPSMSSVASKTHFFKVKKILH